jgi:hypothetical protein
MNRWVAYRESQGHGIRIVPSTLNAESLRRAIRSTASSGKLRYVLLVGDADPAARSDAEVRRRSVPTHYAPAQVNVRWGSEPEIATDNWYADLDDDELPDVAVGRLTADNAAELSGMLDKVLAYERSDNRGDWQRRVNIVAGAGGFGAVLDSLLETVSKEFLTEGIPPAYETSMTYGSWRSPFCPDPRQFQDVVRGRLNEGSLFWVYIGHSRITALDQLRIGDREYHVLGNQDVSLLERSGGAPIALFLSCYTGAFDATRDSLAENLLRSPEGPVAVYCGSRVTMPYAMASMSVALLEEYFVSKRRTLGELVLNAKRKMVEPSVATAGSHGGRPWLDTVAQGVYANQEQLRQERLEHVLLFNLLGDPLLTLKHPGELQMSVADDATAGEKVTVTGQADADGELTVELVTPHGRMRHQLPRRESPPAEESEMAGCNRVYFDANEQRWSAETVHCKAGAYRVDLSIPADASGACFVRAYLDSPKGSFLASAPVTIRAAKDPVIRMADAPALPKRK